MAVTVDSFTTVFPEFESEDSDRITLFIGKAQALVGSSTKWGSLYDEAVELVTAHKLARGNEAAEAENGKATGQITQLRVDNQFTESYAQPSQQGSSQGVDSEYQSTIYGQQYLSLKKRVIGAYVIRVV